MLPSHRLVAAARLLANMTQSELSAKAGVSVSALKNYERGLTSPHASTLAKLMDALREHGVHFQMDSVEGYEGIKVKVSRPA